ncbi:hypothetical protein LC593_17270 [Nostoc sp. CHAB 5844]|nr:hypothetical protein [Nostoc sp. CHAB 5844]
MAELFYRVTENLETKTVSEVYMSSLLEERGDRLNLRSLGWEVRSHP